MIQIKTLLSNVITCIQLLIFLNLEIKLSNLCVTMLTILLMALEKKVLSIPSFSPP